ncbi:NADH dehydrogenase [ubiquinone] 1 beta subcomplex subunit 4-like [Anneissia japonica]|uniref:NADH dehydrogenase [ubiquinone] 1 beta subcomplex subunit 4-like n=1 Tax=Anneissia japonica TaxID=1529436 RepID=UPI001425721F|nr:NADH dehydrogenase [ubiquinone] 1 beta subcomplex subunit 4-like [Anneissia japonica]
MASQSFKGVPAEQKVAEAERAALRDVLRREYQRNIQKPHFKGVLLDPAVIRWNYARVNSYEFFKATPKTTVLGIIVGILPPVLLMYSVRRKKNNREARYKAGEKPPRLLML